MPVWLVVVLQRCGHLRMLPELVTSVTSMIMDQFGHSRVPHVWIFRHGIPKTSLSLPKAVSPTADGR